MLDAGSRGGHLPSGMRCLLHPACAPLGSSLNTTLVLCVCSRTSQSPFPSGSLSDGLSSTWEHLKADTPCFRGGCVRVRLQQWGRQWGSPSVLIQEACPMPPFLSTLSPLPWHWLSAAVSSLCPSPTLLSGILSHVFPETHLGRFKRLLHLLPWAWKC